jgi:alkylation response protein AidB-like acyl-CoA dehydrogenase
MPTELTARTDAGRSLVATAEGLADDFAGRAAAHDRDGAYPFASIEALRRAGYFTAPVPLALGGLGVSSVHDVIVASGRLARGDASVAIGVNMHLGVVLNLVRRWQMARAAGNARREQAFAASLRRLVDDAVVMAGATSEPGQDLSRPRTTAVRSNGGWRVDGHKIFCTMAPAATVLVTSVRFTADDGGERYGWWRSPPGRPACGSTTTGTRSACAPRAATRSRSTASR